MMRLKPEEVLKRYSASQNKKEQWRSIYEDCYKYALPQRNLYEGYYEGKLPGQDKMASVFDSTAISSTQRFANRLQSSLFPAYKEWCRLEPGSDIPPEKKQEVQSVLDEYQKKMFSLLRQTNFDLAIGEFLLDLAVGTSVMLIQPGDVNTPINFTPIPQYLVNLEEGPHGTVDNVYRKFRIRAEALQRQFPEATLSKELQSYIKDHPTQHIDFIEATIFDPEQGDYCYHVIKGKSDDPTFSSSGPSEEILYKRLKDTPFIVSRYMKIPGEVYGRGPLLTALPDIKTLNKTVELLLKNASLAITGVYTAADDGILNPETVKIVPGAIIPVARNSGPMGASLAPLPRAGDFNVAQIEINDLRMQIKKALLDESLPPEQFKPRSATEIAERMKELAQNLGSAFGRLLTETMIPIVKRILSIMDKQGLIDLPLKVNGLEVKMIPVSPLAKAQNLDDVNNMVQFFQITQELGPGGQASVKPEKVAAYIAEKMNIPADILTTEEEQQQIAQQSQQMVQQMMEQQQGAAGPQGQPPEQGMLPEAEMPEGAVEVMKA